MNGFDVDLLVERRSSGGDAFRLEAAFDGPATITVVSGPSGAGKTTLLGALLGTCRPLRGRIVVSGRTLYDSAAGVDLPTRRRGLGIVFQDALLFPHLDVLRNVAFGLRGQDRLHRAAQMLATVGAADLASRHTTELSGGQRQRVALARALAPRPSALLLDEPFSALDAPARRRLGGLLLELQRETGLPFLHVTHDLGEALRLGDRLVLLDGGRVAQQGAPAQVIAEPSSLAAARAVGTENLFGGTILRHDAESGCTEVDLGGTRILSGLLDLACGRRITLGLRAEDVLLSLEPLSRTSARNMIPGVVRGRAPHGPAVELRVTTPVSFRVLVTPASARELDLVPGRAVYLAIKAAAFQLLD